MDQASVRRRGEDPVRADRAAPRARSNKALESRCLPRRCATSLGPTTRTSPHRRRSTRRPQLANLTMAPAKLGRLAVPVPQASRVARCGPVASRNRDAPKAGDAPRIATPTATHEPPAECLTQNPPQVPQALRRCAGTVGALSADRSMTVKPARAGLQQNRQALPSRRSPCRRVRSGCKRCWLRPVSAVVAAVKN